MANEWILDVLSDLKTFAHKNGYHELRAQLDIARRTAQAEIPHSHEGTAVALHADDAQSRTDLGRVGGRL